MQTPAQLKECAMETSPPSTPPSSSTAGQRLPNVGTSVPAQGSAQRCPQDDSPRSPKSEAIALASSLTKDGQNLPPADLALSMSRVSASVKRSSSLSVDETDGSSNHPSIIESIASMAVEATYLGRQNHWHVLMSGLKDIIDCQGGMKASWGEVLNRVRKADIKGAICSVDSPYLNFAKAFPITSDALPPYRRAELAARTSQMLTSCCIERANIDSIQGLVLFAQTVITARRSSSPLLLDPRGFAEDCLQVEYQLLKYPKALRLNIADTEVIASESAQASEPESWHGGRNNPFNPLIRVAALLYIEGLLPESRTVDIYSVLLPILVRQTQNVLQRMTHQQLFQVALRERNSVRAFLLWVCMVGYAVTDFVKAQRGTRVDGSVFENCYGRVLQITLAEAEVDSAEDELALCEILPPSELQLGGSGETMLKQMVAKVEARQRRRESRTGARNGS